MSALEEAMPQASPLRAAANYIEEIALWFGEHLPRILIAVGLLLLGWLLASTLRALMHRAVPRLFRLVPSEAFRRGLKTSGMERGLTDAFGAIVFWLMMLLAIAVATDVLGLPIMGTLATGVARYVPSILAAVLIVIIGMVVGNIARTTVATASTSAGLPYGDLPGRVAQTVILLITAVVAIDQVGINSTFIVVLIAIFLATTLGGLAVAFGLGARGTVSNLLASHYLLQNYQVGQRIRIGALEGRIVQINNVSLMLETTEGRALIPASEFESRPSVLLPDDS
jgi:small-conductance mechanosensitive channel